MANKVKQKRRLKKSFKQREVEIKKIVMQREEELVSKSWRNIWVKRGILNEHYQES